MTRTASGSARHPDHAPVLVLGYANVDLVARVPILPRDGERVTAASIETRFGGMGANAACAAALEGARPLFFGSVGNDRFGALVVEDLVAYGVDVRHLSRSAERTTKALILVGSTGERAIVSEPTRYDPVPLRAFLEGHGGPPGLLYTDGYHVGWASRELRLARQLGFRVYCDLDGAADTYRRDALWAALRDVDIAQWSRRCADSLLPHATPDEADDELASAVPIVIRTAGSERVVITDHGRRELLDVQPVPAAVDATGAGDALAGATVAWLALGSTLEVAVEHGIEAARRTVGHVGARPHKDGASSRR